MSASSDFDIGPLTWVKGEIEQALARAGEALAAYAANPADGKQLKFCKTHLHQTHGALEIVGLDGVTRLTEECEHLVDAIDDGSLAINPERRAALAGAFSALGTYLDELVDGAPHQAVRLFPAYKAVMQARGAERIVESDLFFPDLSPRPPRRANTEVPSDMRAYVLGQRRRFQAGLLRWLRNAADNAALREMTESVRAIERTQAMPQHRAFWWVTIGFTEALVAVGAAASLDAKRLCARIDLQMKRLMEGSQNVAERLLRDTLYFVARSRVQSHQVQEIRRIYALERTIPSDDAGRRDVRPFEAELRALREVVSTAKDKWNRFTGGQAHEITAFQEQSTLLRDQAARLDNTDLAMLASAIAAAGTRVAEAPGNLTESVALEGATALLLAENAVEQFARPAAEFPRQVAAMVARLGAALAGEPTDVPPPMLDEIARRAQERRVMAQVVGEIRGNLGSIETALDAFFRDVEKRGELAGLDVQLRQVAGALAMLGAERAVEAVGQCRGEVARFAAPDYQPVQADFEGVAQVMSALGFYVDALQHGPADFEAAMRPVAPRRPAEVVEEEITAELEPVAADVQPGAEPAALTVEAELEAQRKDARALFEAWRDKPDDSVLAAELKANLAAIRQDADIVDDSGLQQSADRALELLDSPAAGAAPMADIEQAMAGVAPEPMAEAVIAPSAEVSALAASSAEVVDAELLAIFLEEAREVLGTIAERLAAVTAQPADREAVTVIRRGFHTLKGSGRMVGLMRLGEAAWAVEQVMNQWLQDFRSADADHLAMMEVAHRLFDRWVGDLAARGESAADGGVLIAACERLREGGPFEVAAAAPGPAPAAAEVAPAPADEDRVAAMVARGPSGAPDRSVIIGDMRVSPGLYGIFIEESGNHLQTMRAELDLMAAEPQPPRDELLRAAHTLAGIAGTVSFRRLHELARAFERALVVAKSAGIVPDADDAALLHGVVDGIASLVEAVRDLREPPAIEPFEARLEDCRAAWLASSGGIDPHLLQIEVPPLDADIDLPDAQPSGAAVMEQLAADLAAVPIDPASSATIRIRTLDGVPLEENDAPTGALDIDFSDLPDDAGRSPVAADAPADEPAAAFDAIGDSASVDIDFGTLAPDDGATLTMAGVAEAEPGGTVEAGAVAVDFDFDTVAGEPASLAPTTMTDAGVADASLPAAPDAGAPGALPADPDDLSGLVIDLDAPLGADAMFGTTVGADAVIGEAGSLPAAEVAGTAAPVPDPAVAFEAADTPADVMMFAAPAEAAGNEPVFAATEGVGHGVVAPIAGESGMAADPPTVIDPVPFEPAPSGFAPSEPVGVDAFEPAVIEPTVFDPVTTEFSAAEPSAEFAATEPAAAEPILPEPVAAQPEVTITEKPQAFAEAVAPAATPDGGAPATGLFGAAIAAGAMAAAMAAIDAEEAMTLSDAEMRARGLDPAQRALPRIADEIDAQLLPIFLEEAAELMPRLEGELRAWSTNPSDGARANALQRTLHTLKGSARMAGAMAVGQVAHSMETRVENALALPRIPEFIFESLTGSGDRLGLLLDSLRTGAEAPTEVPRAESAATAPAQPAPAPAAEPAVPSPLSVAAAATVAPAALAPALAAAEDAQRALLRVRADLVDRLVNEAGEVAIARSRIEGELRAVKTSLKELTESVNRLRNQLREIEIAAESQMQSRQREAFERHESFDPLEFDRFTRFQELTRMMAESVNDVATVQQNLLKNIDDADLALLSQARMNRDLQGDLMRVRMVPFNTVAERLYRVVRQTAKEAAKRANLDIRGIQTEIDRSVLERMTGPFEHLLRNAIVHGLEAPAVRAANGKAEIGQIVLTARQEGNEFILQFEDDGRGLDYARIRARAIETGLALENDELADAQIAEFIFAPGFSTADAVSAIAGRGVGMDVVRAEVAALGGRIDTESNTGHGTRFTIALPLTLAVTQVVLVRVSGSLYAIPSAMVEQVRQTRAGDLAAAHEAQVVRWQEREYPLSYLPRLLGDGATRAQQQRSTPVLLVRSGTQRAAIHVDEMVGNQEVVVKNIGPQLARVTGIAGATVLGNGQIVLILNPVPLALQALSAGRRSGPDVDPEYAAQQARLALPAAPMVMVVDDSLTVRKITSRLLSRENYQVVTARDGVDALEQLQEMRPDLLLVDIEMPRMDGFDLTRNVRADLRLAGVPIIMITSRTAEKHRKYALEIGVNLFLGKPYQEDELLEGIATLLQPVSATQP